MATLEENLRKIRGEAIYGRDVRAAIAEGITQMDDAIVSEMNSYKSTVTSIANTAVSNMNTKVNQYAQRVDAYDGRMNAMQHDIDTRDLFMKLTDIGSGDYKLTITNAV